MNIELRHLRSFLALAEELNFTRAATRLNMVQQALSTQIQQLEHELGVALFARTTRKVELTAGGRALLEKVPEALRQLEAALVEVRESGRAGSLCLGLLATSSLDFTPKLLRAFAAERPFIRLSVRNVGFSDPTGGVRERATDVALVWQPFTLGNLACEALFEDPRVAVLAADHPLARLEVVPAARLAQEPFVWVDDMDPVARDFWTLADHRAGLAPKVGARVTGFEDLFAAVRAGQAVSASPSSVAVGLPWPDLVTRPVSGLKPAVVAICWRPTEVNPHALALVECARRLASQSSATTSPTKRS